MKQTFNFNPTEIGKIETGWWMAHNNKDKKTLVQLLLKQNILLYNLNKLDASKLIMHLVTAVKGHDTQDWDKAIKEMTKYYKIVKKKTGLNLDPQKSAELEVGWWRLHDELEHVKDKTPLANAFAKLYAEVFGKDLSTMKKGGKFRAEATHEHDLAEDPKTPKGEVNKHWKNTEKLLINFYKELKLNINS